MNSFLERSHHRWVFSYKNIYTFISLFSIFKNHAYLKLLPGNLNCLLTLAATGDKKLTKVGQSKLSFSATRLQSGFSPLAARLLSSSSPPWKKGFNFMAFPDQISWNSNHITGIANYCNLSYRNNQTSPPICSCTSCGCITIESRPFHNWMKVPCCMFLFRFWQI